MSWYKTRRVVPRVFLLFKLTIVRFLAPPPPPPLDLVDYVSCCLSVSLLLFFTMCVSENETVGPFVALVV